MEENRGIAKPMNRLKKEMGMKSSHTCRCKQEQWERRKEIQNGDRSSKKTRNLTDT